ncbi:hypothetical protein [Sphingomicrobium nitratireducens]|uniref:hypothetical protein n=1 Tax=Sphingomicrobium nitratireducens TaxID=2964666 RepID=UPI00223E9FE2|nr:hypothetical protein [Sphingomicrobium nitratireducens]
MWSVIAIFGMQAAALPRQPGLEPDVPPMPRITEERRAVTDCAPDPDAEITVCGRRETNLRMPQMGPPPLNSRGDIMVMQERSRLTEAMPDRMGRCAPVGPGGWTGCMAVGWEKSWGQRGLAF